MYRNLSLFPWCFFDLQKNVLFRVSFSHRLKIYRENFATAQVRLLRRGVGIKPTRGKQIEMCRHWMLIGLALQLTILLLFYRLFFEERTFVVRRTSMEKFPILADIPALEKSKIDWELSPLMRNLTTNVNWKDIPRKSAPPAEEMHDKWIIVTSINPPTDDVKKLAAMEGWKVVIVGDTKTPADWSYPNCVFLDVERQRTLGYRIHDLIPYKSYARKNIGYLYAIQHGAKIIYETDDDNSPTSGKITFHQKDTGDFYVFKTDSVVVNPYGHFGQNTIWPRGYPLDLIADPPSHKFVKCQWVDTSIQQGVVNGDPDVDAIFRLTRKDRGVNLNVEFDAEAPPVVLPPNTFAPFNSQNTLFLQKAFWALLLPTTVPSRVTDIWRGYWAQRLMWEVGSQLSFFAPNAVQVRNAHNYLSDFKEELPMYRDSTRLVKFLVKWEPKKEDLFGKVLELSVAMAENGFYGVHDAILTEAWLADLVSIGYEMPAFDPVPKPCKYVISEETELHPKEMPSSYLRAGNRLKS